MALGNGNNYNSGPLIFLSPRSKKDNKKVTPHFEIARVVDGKIARTNETCKSVSGDLIKLEFKEKTVKGDTVEEIVLYVADKSSKETYRIGLSYGIASRSLFNALASLTSFDNLEFSYYENKKGYDAYSLKQNGETVKWKYELDALPKAKEINDSRGKLIKNDYYDLNEFFKKELLEIVTKLGGKTSEKAEKAPAGAVVEGKKENSVASSKPNVDEDVPF